MERANRLANPKLTTDLSLWGITAAQPAELFWLAEEAPSKPTSGSTRVAAASGAGQVWSLSQCAPVAVEEALAGSTRCGRTTDGSASGALLS